MRLVLLGAPGAGKGTQCKHIATQYDLLHLSSGDILRKERAAGIKLGKKAQSFMDSGVLVPDELILEMMTKAIKKALPPVSYWMAFPELLIRLSSSISHWLPATRNWMLF